MKKTKRLLLVCCITAFLFIINFSIDMNSSINAGVTLDFMELKAQGSNPGSSEDCSRNGYRNWNASNPLLPSGKDCWCTDRDDVKNDCNL